LIKKGFFIETEIPTGNLFFCEKRIQKRGIAEALQLNCFIDDRWSVLRHLDALESIKRLYLFNPFPTEKIQFESENRGEKILLVESWEQVLDSIEHERRNQSSDINKPHA